MAYLTTVQVAKMLSVSDSEIRKLIARKRIKAIKPGHDWMIHESEVARFRRRTPGRHKKY